MSFEVGRSVREKATQLVWKIVKVTHASPEQGGAAISIQCERQKGRQKRTFNVGDVEPYSGANGAVGRTITIKG
ncbi:hypothetical protein SAMN05444172_2595 [Burkholderia sp. GAS332]|nr:hypothetical protein SAMN05444172_2595 [Burkholderia sp. GAS332]